MLKWQYDNAKKALDTYNRRVEDLKGFIKLGKEELEKRDCSMKTQMMIAVMAEEIFINIAHYAYTDKTGQVKICLDFKGDDFYLTFID